jgi:peroxiredoxin Q/BCP
MVNIGEKAPDFRLASGEGRVVSLKDLKGKKIVLYFYPKDDTPGCTKEACSFEQNRAALKKKGAVIIGISADSPDSHSKFAEKYGLSFPLLSDEKREIIKLYDVWKEKSLYGKKYFGIERTTFVIDENGFIRHIFSKVKVDGHTDEVLAVL